MSEIKPVYQTRFIATGFPEAWVNTDIQLFNHRKSQPERFETRILYPAAAYEALRKEKDKIENELDEYKEHHEELTEHYKALQFLESEFRKENADLQLRLDAKTLSHQMMLDRTLELQAENDEQKRKIISLENELVEWNEFKKIRDAQMQALRKQMP